MVLILAFTIIVGCKRSVEEVSEEVESGTEEETTEEVSETDQTNEEQNEVSEELSSKEKITIAVIPPMLDHPWYKRCKDGAVKAAKDLKIDLIFEAAQDVNAEMQLNIFHEVIERGVDAVLISAADPELLKEPINEAISAGIPVFGFDIGATGSDILFLASGLEPETTGEIIGEGLVKEINGKGKVALLTSVLEQEDLKKRRGAILAVLERYSQIELVGIYANENDFVKGLNQCHSVLEENPDLAVFASDVESGIPTASQAVIDKGLGGKVAIWGIGMPQQNSEFIKNGIAGGVFTLDPADMAYIGVMMAYRYLTEGVLPKEGDEFDQVKGVVVMPEEKTLYAPSFKLTPENVDNFDF